MKNKTKLNKIKPEESTVIQQPKNSNCSILIQYYGTFRLSEQCAGGTSARILPIFSLPLLYLWQV